MAFPNHCAACDKETDLQEHHLSYGPEVTVLLCNDCHSKIHGHGTGKGVSRKKIEVARSLKEYSHTYSEISAALEVNESTARKYVNKSGYDGDVHFFEEPSEFHSKLYQRLKFSYNDYGKLVNITNYDDVELPD